MSKASDNGSKEMHSTTLRHPPNSTAVVLIKVYACVCFCACVHSHLNTKPAGLQSRHRSERTQLGQTRVFYCCIATTSIYLFLHVHKVKSEYFSEGIITSSHPCGLNKSQQKGQVCVVKTVYTLHASYTERER